MKCDEIAGSDSPEAFFAGVRFVLIGFDSVSESQYREELVRRGAIDVGKYDQSCTHVIVSGRVYDDPVCVAARKDGKMLATELWIEDSVDFGTMADTSRILYRPVMDFNGIPGSDKLCVCLTGYQRRERDDIMKMVELIGAHFSKPLIATKITHLICYKFEGEKYELAKKVNIKLVNHRWLEDCLKAWEILPIDGYTKSGWELEMEEAEAKDSEEEAEVEGGKPLIHGSTTEISGNQSNTQKLRNLDLSVQKISASKMATSSVSPLSTNGKSYVHKMEDLHDPRSLATSGNNLATACPSADAVDIRKNENRSSPGARTLCGAVYSDVARESHTPIKFSNEGKMPFQYGESTLKELSPFGSLLESSAPHGSDREQNKHTTESFNSRPTSAELHLSEMDESSNQLLEKRTMETMGTMSSSPKSDQQNSGTRIFGSPLTNSRSVRTDNPSATNTDGTKCSPRIAHKRSPLARVTTAHSPGGHDVGPLTSVSSSYKRRHLENRQPLFRVQKSDILSAGQLAKDDDKGSKGMNTYASPSGSLPALGSKSSTIIKASTDTLSMDVHENAISGDASNRESMGNGSRELEAKVIDGDVSDGPSSGENNLNIRCNDSRKCEVEKLKALDVTNANLNIQATDVGQQAPKVDEGLLDPKSAGSFDSKNPCIGKVGTTSDKLKKKVAMKKLGNRLRVVGKTSISKHSMDSGKVPADGGVLLDSEKTKEVTHAMTGTNKIAADSVLGQVVSAVTKREASPKNASKSKNKKAKIDRIDGPENPGKENLPVEDGHPDMNLKGATGKVDDKHGENSQEHNDQAHRKCSKGNNAERNKKMLIPEPVCFLLSGHRLQRKEFQQVIRCLRGKVCRDSHQWSYQATHFIVPDLVRRTEKFFAAAAAGRWILKSDYLLASNEAGKFLEEEPFEWHKNGLTEDGAINLAAPRKWRKLKERTGHGALYGMCIIVYGECIMPSLDTLKRVVKAGDGTILATSPPYTRFLSSGVDFAIISPGMPRVDIWVQEFLRHEIPCVLVDYLVEYVCKTGYPLERHVLFNTHAWIDKSFANLQSRLEEIVCDASPLPEEDDLPCVVCGSRDRGEVMLICGNEMGTVGCGIGTHIDCCDPPLDAVPAGDWFCHKCSNSNQIGETVKGKKKGKCSRKLR